jgi:hypothetical protein
VTLEISLPSPTGDTGAARVDDTPAYEVHWVAIRWPALPNARYESGVTRNIAAGELGSGVYFNPVAPEAAARALRNA